MRNEQNKFRKVWTEWSGLLAALSVSAGATVFLYQIYHWLRFGDWLRLPIAEVFGWDLAAVRWIGLRYVFDLIGSMGLAFFLAAVPFAILVFVDWYFELGSGDWPKN